jgi:hypothetical protein
MHQILLFLACFCWPKNGTAYTLPCLLQIGTSPGLKTGFFKIDKMVPILKLRGPLFRNGHLALVAVKI